MFLAILGCVTLLETGFIVAASIYIGITEIESYIMLRSFKKYIFVEASIGYMLAEFRIMLPPRTLLMSVFAKSGATVSLKTKLPAINESGTSTFNFELTLSP
jgi:hypothetical protein